MGDEADMSRVHPLVPRDEADLADLIKGANGPVSVRGGNTRGMAPDGAALSVAALGGITLYEPGALTLVARAGTPVADIEAALRAEGQRLAFEPMDHRGLLGTDGAPTLGGMMAANVSGPRRIAVGAARDFALGVRFVDGAGTVIKNGGRVMKNVTGYDLVKLMCGARGTLGVLTEVSLKVLPSPECTQTLCVPAETAEDAVALMSRALGTPFEVSGAAFDGTAVALRLEGFEASVAYRINRLQSALGGEAQDVDWTAIRDVAAFAGMDGDVWRLSVKPSDAPRVLEALPEGSTYQLDWGGGLIWVLCPQGSNPRLALDGVPGHATRVRGSGPAPAVQPQSAGVDQLQTALRRRFDPRGLFSPALEGA
ncbi:MAG: FAD-binding protein [Pseudomonadota bacterium]